MQINKAVPTKTRILWIIATCLFVISLPLLLVSLNLRIVISEIRLYEHGFQKYDVSMVTGIEDDELRKAADGLITYFNTSAESAQIQVIKNGEVIDLFSQRELDHLEDVKALIRLLYSIQWVVAGYILIFVVAGFIAQKRAFLRRLLRVLFTSSIFTLGSIALIGLWALIDFDGLFLQFHLTSFQNDLWLLDPSRHHLIMMFPENFFLVSALIVIGSTVLEAVILAVAAITCLKRGVGSDKHLI